VMGVTRCHTPITINKDTDRIMYGGRMDVMKVIIGVCQHTALNRKNGGA
jgi:hypothetical protein